jgi:hypothetical protein
MLSHSDFQTFFPRVPPVTTQNKYAYHYVLQILMDTFRILIWDVSLAVRFEVFKSANQRNNSAVETSNFAVSTFLI